MTFQNKNHFLSLAFALFATGGTIVSCPSDSPEIELFRKEFCLALQTHSGKQITDVIKKHRSSVCAIDTYAALFLAQGYILGQLTLKKHSLETWAITPSKQKDAMVQEVKDLERTYADLKKMIKSVPDEDQDIFEILSQRYSAPYYHALLVAIHNLSAADVKNAIEKYHPHQLPIACDERLVTPLKLAVIYAAALAELKRSDPTASHEVEALENIQALFEREGDLRLWEMLAEADADDYARGGAVTESKANEIA